MNDDTRNEDHPADDDHSPPTPYGEQPDEINLVRDNQPVHGPVLIPPTFNGLLGFFHWLALLLGSSQLTVAYQLILICWMIHRLTNIIPIRFGSARPFHPPFAPDRRREPNRIQHPWDEIPIERLFSPTVTLAVGENIGVEGTTPHDYDPIPDRIARQTVEIPDADDNNEDATNDYFEPTLHDLAVHGNFDHIVINEVDAVEDDTIIGEVDGYEQMVQLGLRDLDLDTESDSSSETDNESEATTTTSDSDSDTNSMTSSDNHDGTGSDNDADDENSSTTTESRSRTSSFSSSDNNDPEVNEDAKITATNNDEEAATLPPNDQAVLVQLRVNDFSSNEVADRNRRADDISTLNRCRALVPYIRKSDNAVIPDEPQDHCV